MTIDGGHEGNGSVTMTWRRALQGSNPDHNHLCEALKGGSLDIEAYSKFMTDWDNLKGSEDRKNKIKNEISECTKDGASTRDQFNKVDECIYNVYRTNCPEATKKLEEQAKNEYFTACR